MSDAPERIWIIDGANGYVERGEWATEYAETTDVEYVPIDQIAVLVAENKRLRELAGQVIEHLEQYAPRSATSAYAAALEEGGE